MRHDLALGIFGLCLVGCATPIGMYGHDPGFLWRLSASPAEVTVPRCTAETLVVKFFESEALVPVGAHFVGAEPQAESMTQSYAPKGDLILPLFEATAAKLRVAGCTVWEDYAPSREMIERPPRTTSFLVVHGTVRVLEVSSFYNETLDDAARVKIDFNLIDPGGAPVRAFTVDTSVRIHRGAGDLLVALGQRVALGIVDANTRSH